MEFKPDKYYCSKCGEIIYSKYCGEFSSCSCGASYVDQTFSYIRCGGCACRFENGNYFEAFKEMEAFKGSEYE